MKIVFEKEEAEEIFYNALCNAVGTNYMNGYGLEMRVNKKEYETAKLKLTDEQGPSVCYEEILMQVLKDGGSLTLKDIEGDDDNTESITLKDVHERMPDVPVKHLMDVVTQQDDAITADVIIQTIFYKEVIFG